MSTFKFVFVTVFLILSTSLFTSCEADNINEENRLLNEQTELKAIDKDEVPVPGDPGEDDHDNE